jgi:hypothetical protein
MGDSDIPGRSMRPTEGQYHANLSRKGRLAFNPLGDRFLAVSASVDFYDPAFQSADPVRFKARNGSVESACWALLRTFPRVVARDLRRRGRCAVRSSIAAVVSIDVDGLQQLPKFSRGEAVYRAAAALGLGSEKGRRSLGPGSTPATE